MKIYIYKLKKGFFTGLGIALGIILAIGTAALLSFSVTLNTFTSGTPINAAKINENFANLKTAVEAVVPVGTILSYGGTTAPDGFLICNGASISRAGYPALFAAIGTAFGTVDSNNFNIPDLRGRFVRGLDTNAVGSEVDPDRDDSVDSGVDGKRYALYFGGNKGQNVGSYQKDAFMSHTHGFYNHQLGPGGSNSWSWFSPNAGYGFDTGAKRRQ